MKRRLDLALALVHRPSILFLDEPTTGLDPQSRSALWDEVERLARQDGVTVFLTTQYLEEADVLADRVGIIDRGKIVAEGTPDELKRDIGGDTVEAIPADPHDLERAAEVLAAFGQRAAHSPKGAAVRLGQGAEQLPDIVRALDDAGIALRTPAAALAVARRRLPGQDRALAGGRGRGGRGGGRGGGAGVIAELVHQVGFVARRSVRRTLRQPALIVPTLVFPLFLLAVNASGLGAATKIPGFPTNSYLDFAITVTFIQGAMFSAITAGTELATDIDTGFLDRLQLTPLRRVTILVGQMAGATTLALIGALAYLVVGIASGVDIKSGPGGAIVLVLYAVFIAVAFAGIGATLGARTGSPEAVQGAFPLMFAVFFLSSMSMPRDLIAVHWFRTVATWNPASYLIEGLRSLVITGWDATALWRGLAVGVGVLALSFWAASRALATRMART